MKQQQLWAILILVLFFVQIQLIKGGGKKRKARHAARNSHHHRKGKVHNNSLSPTFPRHFQPIKRGDTTLIQLVRKYLKELYPKGAKEELNHVKILRNEAKNEPFRAQTVFRNWAVAECKTMGLDTRVIKTIHKGSRNLVLKIWDRKGKRPYVWKRYDNSDEYTLEVAFFTVANHPNIVKPVCVQRCAKTKLPGLLMEFVKGSPSLEYAARHKNDPKKVKIIAAQAYDVLKYIHWLGYIHADFKPENLLVNEDGNAIAIDFGYAIVIPYYKYYRGTPNTIAPELVKVIDGPIEENIDAWALCSSIAQWFGVGKVPVDQKGSKRGHKWVPVRISKRRGYLFGAIPKNFPPKLCQLLYYCMNPNPLLRKFNTKEQLEWFEALPFWDGIDFNTIGYDWLGENY